MFLGRRSQSSFLNVLFPFLPNLYLCGSVLSGPETFLTIDSYMNPLLDLNEVDFRLLEVDNGLVLPFNVQSRVLATFFDVIHSWTIHCL